ASAEPGKDAAITLSVFARKYFYQETWFRVLALVLALAAIIGAARYYTIRKLKQQRIQFEKQKAIESERLRISSDLHDDLGGGLSTIHLMTEMMRTPGMTTNNEKYLQNISEKSQELVQSMNEIVWSLNNNNDNLPGMISYIREYAGKYL